MKNFLSIVTAITLVSSPLFAQPIEISADNTLEWHKEKQLYIATGNAVATQKDTQIQADTLTAHYKSSESSNTEITKIIAEGNVIITSPSGQVVGEHGVYLVTEEHATLTGETLKFTGENSSIEASKSFEYWPIEQKFKATGDTILTENNRILNADEVTAWFIETTEGSDNEEKSNGLKEANAIGNVVIITDTDKAYGDTGHYDGIKEIATLTGNVKILREKNVLNGNKATVNLKTGISQLFGDENGGRVTGTFFTKSK